jgi:hypothetical protein
MIEEKYIEARVASMSLIGVGKERPCGWGNYFWFTDESRCLNMWAENLKSAKDRFLTDGLVKVRRYTAEEGNKKGCSWSIVIDDRIPGDWLYNKLCTTGGWPPPLEFAKDMYEILGDPTYELERYIDPEMYYAKRGEEYFSESGIVRCYGSNREEHTKRLVDNLLKKREQVNDSN